MTEGTSDFEAAARAPRKSALREFAEFLKETKKYWLIPIAIVFLVIAAILTLANTAVAPFIYTLF